MFALPWDEIEELHANRSRTSKLCTIFSAFVLGMMVATIGLLTAQHYGFGDSRFAKFFFVPAAPRVRPVSVATGRLVGSRSPTRKHWSLQMMAPSRGEGEPDAAASTRPSPDLSPWEVVSSQLTALQINDVQTALAFASPNAWYLRGLWQSFELMSLTPEYSPLVRCSRFEILGARPMSPSKHRVRVRVWPALDRSRIAEVLPPDLDYNWDLTKQEGGSEDGCWMVDSVMPDASLRDVAVEEDSLEALRPSGTRVSIPNTNACQDKFAAALHAKGRVKRGNKGHFTQIVVNDLPCSPLADTDLDTASLFIVTVLESIRVYVFADDEFRDGVVDRDLLCLNIGLFGPEETPRKTYGFLFDVNRCSDKRSGNQMMRLADHLFSCTCHTRVWLSDQSYLPCGRFPVGLGLFRTVTAGQSFYQKFGFQYIVDDPYEPKLRDNLALEQKALYNLKVEELQHVYETCRQNGTFGGHGAQTILRLFSAFKRQHSRRKGILVGEFFKWLWTREWDRNCILASKVLDETFIFPCSAYPSEILRKLRKAPQLTGDMMKEYAYPL